MTLIMIQKLKETTSITVLSGRYWPVKF